jgi:hypothetical protein
MDTLSSLKVLIFSSMDTPSSLTFPCTQVLMLSCVISAGPDDMPAHIKSSMFGCTLTCDDLILIVRTVYLL